MQMRNTRAFLWEGINLRSRKIFPDPGKEVRKKKINEGKPNNEEEPGFDENEKHDRPLLVDLSENEIEHLPTTLLPSGNEEYGNPSVSSLELQLSEPEDEEPEISILPLLGNVKREHSPPPSQLSSSEVELVILDANKQADDSFLKLNDSENEDYWRYRLYLQPDKIWFPQGYAHLLKDLSSESSSNSSFRLHLSARDSEEPLSPDTGETHSVAKLD